MTASTGARRAGHDSARSPQLIVIRGNSASGKSAAAAAIRARYGRRDLAIVGQDNLRRVVLRERDVPGGANIDLIDQTARFALSRGYHTIVEGIFNADHYGAMLTALISDHPGSAIAYFLDVPFPETLRRHTMKEGVLNYGEAEMRRPTDGRGRRRRRDPGGHQPGHRVPRHGLHLRLTRPARMGDRRPGGDAPALRRPAAYRTRAMTDV
ncbi:MAG: hypothetical protein ACRDNW_24950, partial [Trebonia sp.]